MFQQVNSPRFNQKYLEVPSIFNDWISPYIDLKNATILDFGCGDGVISLGIATHLSPKAVIGVDIQYLYTKLSAVSKFQLGLESLPENLKFRHIRPGVKIADELKCNCIFSWSVFEHIDKDMLNNIIKELHNTLDPDGYFFIQIQPLYYSAFGSHLNGIIDRPWAHLLEQKNHIFSEISEATRRVDDDDNSDFSEDYDFMAYKYLVWKCYQSLNKITGDQIVDLFESNGFQKIREHRTECQNSPPPELSCIYNIDILKNDQIVLLFQKR